ncbi:MAG: substrate-binding domain-containing protein, partial [Pseudolabrys sp.]|nr:substrate-binding domain-containing protein [Pseudolabrys sp.]
MTGHKVTTTYSGTLDVKKRIAGGEHFDILIMASPDIDEFVKSGVLAAGSRVDLAKSGVGAGVKAGAPKYDISTTEALKKTLTSVKSIGYSTGP